MNLSTLWLLLTRRSETLLLIIAGLVLFGGGWQLGRVMSPYYAAQPIIFQEADGSPIKAASDPAALAALRQEAPATPNSQLAAATPSAAETIAGTSDTTQTPPAGEGSGLFVGSVNSNLYHHKDCSAWLRIKEANRLWFATKEAAEQAGYGPSQCTREKFGL